CQVSLRPPAVTLCPYTTLFRSCILNSMSTFAVILPAAGESRRFHDKAYKKPFAPLGGRAVWLHSAERFMNRADVKQVIVCVSARSEEHTSELQSRGHLVCRLLL